MKAILCAAVFAALCAVPCRAPAQAGPATSKPGRKKPPRPAVLPPGRLERDSATGELRRVEESGPAATPPAAGAAIRARVALVEVSATVTGADGKPLRGLRAGDFRVYEDGAEQPVAHFDASTEPASIALVMDASPSIFRELGEMRAAARTLAAHLAPGDEIGVVAFSREAHLLLPLTRDRAALERALASRELARVANESRSNIYQAVYLTARDLLSGRTGRKAIMLLTDGQDSGLGLGWDPATAAPRPGETAGRVTFEDVVRILAARGIELYAISAESRPNAMTPDWLEAHRTASFVTHETRRAGVPAYTAYLAELVRRAGGRLYFLREMRTLGEVYQRIAETLAEQYLLGYYPAAGLARPGWRTLRVDLPGRTARVAHHAAYYVPPGEN